MPLICGNRLLERFVELVGEAKRIDIAVAWASSCDAIEALAASDADIRAVVGPRGIPQIQARSVTLTNLWHYALRQTTHRESFTQSTTAFMVKRLSAGLAAQILREGVSAGMSNLSTSSSSRQRETESGLNAFGQV